MMCASSALYPNSTIYSLLNPLSGKIGNGGLSLGICSARSTLSAERRKNPATVCNCNTVICPDSFRKRLYMDNHFSR
jgi:hypothetical protein